MADIAQQRLTAAEFDDLTAHDERRFELINGEVIEMAPPSIQHQRLLFGIAKYIDALKPDGEVFIAPIEVYLDEHNIPQPDIAWVAANSPCQIEELRLIGAPDLVVEILSPSTAKRDKTDKFSLYEQHGTREYWIVDPQYQQIEVWARSEDKFQRQGVFAAGDTFESAALGGKTVEVAPIFS